MVMTDFWHDGWTMPVAPEDEDEELKAKANPYDPFASAPPPAPPPPSPTAAMMGQQFAQPAPVLEPPLNPNAGGFRDPVYNPPNVTPGGAYAPNPDMGIFDIGKVQEATRIPVYSDFAENTLIPAVNAAADPLGIQSWIQQNTLGTDIGVGDIAVPVTGFDVGLNALTGGGLSGFDDLARAGGALRQGAGDVFNAAMPEPQLFPGLGAGIPPINPMGGEEAFGFGSRGAAPTDEAILAAQQEAAKNYAADLQRSLDANPSPRNPRGVEPAAAPPFPERYPSFPVGTIGEQLPDVVGQPRWYHNPNAAGEYVPDRGWTSRPVAADSPASAMGAPEAYNPAYIWTPERQAADAAMRNLGVGPTAPVDDTAQQMRDAFQNVRRQEDILTGGGVPRVEPTQSTPPPASTPPTPEELDWINARPALEKPVAETPAAPRARTLEPPAYSAEGQRMAQVDRILPPTPQQALADQQRELQERITAQVQRVEAGNGRALTPIEKMRIAQEERVVLGIPNDAVKLSLGHWLNVPRTLMTGIDFSYPLRQGVALVRHQKEFWPAVKSAWDAAFDDSTVERVMLDIQNNPRAPLKRELDITLGKTDVLGREEAFAGMGAVGKIPIVGKPLEALYGPLARSNEVFINKFRSDVADNFIDKIKRFEERGMFNKAGAQDQIDKYMRTINYATMRGALGPLEKHGGALGQVFFSIRSAISRPQLVGQLIDKPFTPAWNEAAMDLAAFLGLGYTTLQLAEMAGANVNYDPRSTDFGKIVVGNRHIDIWGGYQQLARGAYQAVTGEKVTSAGNVRDVKATAVARDYLRNKLSPQAGATVNTVFPSDFRKPPVDFSGGILNPKVNAGEAASLFAPLFAQDVYEAVKHDGVTGGLLAVPGFFGVGGMSYADTSNPRTAAVNNVMAKPENLAALPPNVAEFLEGKSWNAATPKEQRAILDTLSPEERAAVEKGEQVLRDRKDIFQLNRDEARQRAEMADQQREALKPLADKLLQDWKSGAMPPDKAVEAIKRVEARADKEANFSNNIGPKLSESKAYQDAVKGIDPSKKTDDQKEVDRIREISGKYYNVYDDPRVNKPDGTKDWDKIEAAQKAIMDTLRKQDPGFATRVEFNLAKNPDSDYELTKWITKIDDRLDKAGYFDVPSGKKTEFARSHPDVDALLSLKYGNPVHSQKAGQILSSLAPEREIKYAK